MALTIDEFVRLRRGGGVAQGSVPHRALRLARRSDAEPSPVTGDPVADTYVFERDARLAHEGSKMASRVYVSDLAKHVDTNRVTCGPPLGQLYSLDIVEEFSEPMSPGDLARTVEGLLRRAA